MSDPNGDSLTPIDTVSDMWVKRDDLFEIAGVCGGKARACAHLLRGAKYGVVTASARQSPQAQIVARVARHFGLPCRIHTAAGAETPEIADAARAGAEIARHAPGYTSVIIARARADSERLGWTLVPFGMESADALGATSNQARNLPPEARRLVVPVGSGVTLAAILHGLRGHTGSATRPPAILAVQIGADPTQRLDRLAPAGWRELVSVARALIPYHRSPKVCELGGISLDPIYEAKCLPFLRPGDCLWIVGRRSTREG
jgi:1-aminocyclopropane-1-carboxylate deaminase/D-cysteine desulfhydrase-like pyridoxal-dependent ACC family enzyme